MIPLLEFKTLLGEYGANLTDKEIEEIRVEQYKVAEMAFKIWIQKKGLNNLRNRQQSVIIKTDER